MLTANGLSYSKQTDNELKGLELGSRRTSARGRKARGTPTLAPTREHNAHSTNNKNAALAKIGLRITFRLQTSLKRAAGVIVPSLISQLPLSDLDGLTVWHEVRLEEEDVENIPNRATADLVDLFLDTRLAPERLIAWTDQAILYTQLGPQEKGKPDLRHALRALGIRTATSFLEAAKVECREDREVLNGIISPHSKNEGAIRTLAAALTNPNLKLVQQWHVPSNISSNSALRSGPRKAA